MTLVPGVSRPLSSADPTLEISSGGSIAVNAACACAAEGGGIRDKGVLLPVAWSDSVPLL